MESSHDGPGRRTSPARREHLHRARAPTLWCRLRAELPPLAQQPVPEHGVVVVLYSDNRYDVAMPDGTLLTGQDRRLLRPLLVSHLQVSPPMVGRLPLRFRGERTEQRRQNLGVLALCHLGLEPLRSTTPPVHLYRSQHGYRPEIR